MSLSEVPVLSIIVFLPLLGSLLLLLLRGEKALKAVALVVSLATFIISLALYVGWKQGDPGMQFLEQAPWVPQLGISYLVAVDGLSLLLVLLTTFLMPLVFLFSWNTVHDKLKTYLVLMLLLETAMLGVFVALDLVLFFVFFEASLIPMYFLIGRWGGPRRVYAALKFFLYTATGSAFLLAAIIALGYLYKQQTGAWSFNLLDLYSLGLPANVQTLLFFGFALAFAIKVPLFPFHTWLPDAHVEAPTGGSVILAAILLKMGTYGFLRFSLPLFPAPTLRFAPLFIVLALIGILYGALVALAQKDVKKLVAYSSVAHLGFVILGIFALQAQSISGAVLQMVNHGLSTGALFLLVGFLYERRHTRMLDDFGGIWKFMPVYAAIALITFMSSAGLPGLNGFVGEFTILLGTTQANVTSAVLGTLGIILGAWYLLWAFAKIFKGPSNNAANADLKDLSLREVVIMAPLVVMFIVIGLFPNFFLSKVNPSVDALLNQVNSPAAVMRYNGNASGEHRAVGGKIDNAMTLPTINFLAILPQIIVVAAALLVLLIDALIRDPKTGGRVVTWVALLALLLAGAAAVWLSVQPEPQAFQEMAVADGYALIFMVVILIAGALGVLLAQHTIPQISSQVGSYYALLLLAVAGMMMMAAAIDLIVVFLALEIFSLALYILVGFNRYEARSAEASLKYFLLGAFASGFFLYGMALIYGATATTNLSAIAAALTTVRPDQGSVALFLYAGTALLIVGFGFKVAMVPFHMWTPDAYQGAPTPVTGFMSVATKAAAFAAFMRVFVLALPASHAAWGWALAILAALTMTLGNLAALRQTSLKRMLAYSSIAHAGYAMVGLVPGTSQGVSAVLFYMLAYAFMNLGAFAVIVALERAGENDVLNGQFAGLADRRPALAAVMSVFMFSLAGIPPLAGFFAKFFVFSAALDAGWGWLVVIGVVNSVISAFYYLGITVQMYFRPTEEASGRAKKSKAAAAPVAVEAIQEAPALASSARGISLVLIIAAAGTFLVGLWPTPWATWITQAVQAVFGG